MQVHTQVHMQMMFATLMHLMQACNMPHTSQGASNSVPTESAQEQSLGSILNSLGGLNLSEDNLLSTTSEFNVPRSLPTNNLIGDHHPRTEAVNHTSDGAVSSRAEPRRDLARTTSTSTQEGPKISYTSHNPPGHGCEGAPSMGGLQNEQEFQSLVNQNVYQDESLARHEHSLIELQHKNECLERTQRELKLKIKSLEGIVNDMDGRYCNGTYFWKIKNYSKFRRDAEHGDNTAIHSPPFYSHYYGYKMCLRVNLNGVDTSRGTHLSIFVHFMQGDYDDVIVWPFWGNIKLVVVDQNEICEMRHHVIENLVSKPNLAAFQRPQTPRNHKGFGYMEFLPLSMLDNSTYIKNDSLIIKAIVSNSSSPTM